MPVENQLEESIMNTVLWIVQGLLAAAFLGAGSMKLALPRKRLADRGAAMAWVTDFSDGAVKAIGVAEVLGAAGLVLPAALGIAPLLTPLAGAGLVLLMAGAAVTHVRRGENGLLGGPVLLALLSLAVAVLRFGPYPS
jgi:hypothetical protein